MLFIYCDVKFFFFGYEYFVFIFLDNVLCFGLFLFFVFYKLDISNIKNNFVMMSFFVIMDYL